MYEVALLQANCGLASVQESVQTVLLVPHFLPFFPSQSVPEVRALHFLARYRCTFVAPPPLAIDAIFASATEDFLLFFPGNVEGGIGWNDWNFRRCIARHTNSAYRHD